MSNDKDNKVSAVNEPSPPARPTKPKSEAVTQLSSKLEEALSNQIPGQFEPEPRAEGMPEAPGVFLYKVTDLGKVGFRGRDFDPGSLIYLPAEEALRKNTHGKYLEPQLDASGKKFKQLTENG